MHAFHVVVGVFLDRDDRLYLPPVVVVVRHYGNDQAVCAATKQGAGVKLRRRQRHQGSPQERGNTWSSAALMRETGSTL